MVDHLSSQDVAHQPSQQEDLAKCSVLEHIVITNYLYLEPPLALLGRLHGAFALV